VPIRIGASFVPLSCTDNSAVLGSAGANEIWSDFTNAPRTATWYPSALASKLAGQDVSTPGEPHIIARFNSRLGLSQDCLPGSGFYLGLDNNFGDQIDLVTVLLHEFAHGLGFQTFTDDETGAEIQGIPSIWDYYLLNNRTGKHLGRNDGRGTRRIGRDVARPVLERSHRDRRRAAGARPDLEPGVGGGAAGTAAGNYAVGDASFGPPLSNPPVAGQLMPVVDQANGTGLACDPLNALNSACRARQRRPGRPRHLRLRHQGPQRAGGRRDRHGRGRQPAGRRRRHERQRPGITIPSVRVTQADGITLKAACSAARAPSRASSPASVSTRPPGRYRQRRAAS
jgi:hypothetical protein